jgi:hypothetical protein
VKFIIIFISYYIILYHLRPLGEAPENRTVPTANLNNTRVRAHIDTHQCEVFLEAVEGDGEKDCVNRLWRGDAGQLARCAYLCICVYVRVRARESRNEDQRLRKYYSSIYSGQIGLVIRSGPIKRQIKPVESNWSNGTGQ